VGEIALSTPSVQGIHPAMLRHKDAVMELYRVREYFDEGVPEFAAGIAAALQETVEFQLQSCLRSRSGLPDCSRFHRSPLHQRQQF